MRFIWVCPISFEPWDWSNPDKVGVGGSETAVCEMAWRLARRGHEVTVFAPIPGEPTEHRGVKWLHIDAVDHHLNDPGIWVLSRCPGFVQGIKVIGQKADKVGPVFPRHEGQRTWVVCQDVDYARPGVLVTEESSAKIDRMLALCPAHVKHLSFIYPFLKDKITLSTNGIRVDLIEQIMTATPFIKRNPHRIVWTSSPDRGLMNVMRIFKRAREVNPKLELVACYGLDNIKKCHGIHWRNVEKDVAELANEPGVTWAARLNQPELYRTIMSAGLWVYPTSFTETSCISAAEAQAMGAVPIFSPLWALADNVAHGWAIEGDPNVSITQARFVKAIIDLTHDLDHQERIRQAAMRYARNRFDWERVVDQYEKMANDDL